MMCKILTALQICLQFTFIVNSCFAQNCDCTISEVQNNNVNPCNKTIGSIDTVYTASELMSAINQANNSGGNMTILIANGTYQISSPSWYPYITASNVVFRSLSGNRNSVVLSGGGMRDVAPATENGIYFVGDNNTIADLTIKDVGNHGIATHGDSLFVHNVRIQNTYEQMLKGTSASDGADDGIVQCCLFEYPAGVGPQFYIGGLDIHEGDNWIVRDNIFRNIQSPSGSLAEHAVHFWNSSSNNTVERNMIYNCDRGIGFGLGSSPNDGGMIRNNMIYNDGSGLFDDVGIGLETSPNTKVYNNTIYVDYPNAIEYRFAATSNVDITNNLCNKAITSRNGGTAMLSTNNTNAIAGWFANLAIGDLHLSSNNSMIVDQGSSLPLDVSDDIDKTGRPQGLAFDIGAHEFTTSVNISETENSTKEVIAHPNPATNSFTLTTRNLNLIQVSIFDKLNQKVISHTTIPSQSEIDICAKGWDPGIYTCQLITSDNSIHFSKILIVN